MNKMSLLIFDADAAADADANTTTWSERALRVGAGSEI